jgi:hypothetical protein
MLASHITIHTDFFSTTHRISGKVLVGANGLLGLLNDVNTSLVEVENAYLSRLAEPSKIEAHFERLSVNKHNLELVILTRREDLGPVGLARGGYTQVASMPVMLTTAVYEIRGVIEITSKLDASALLTGGTGKYTPVYKVSIHSTLYPESPFTGEAIALNRTLVESLAPLPKGKA